MTKKSSHDSLDSLNLYFQRVKKIASLSAEEEKELIIKAKDEDPEAFKRLILANQKIVVKEALKYYFKDDNFLDLINEGNKGLIEALKRFDPNRENRFYTYALWWVRSEIKRYLSKNQNIISLPDIFYNDYLNFKKAHFKLSRDLKRRPTDEEVAEYLEIPVKKVKVMMMVPNEILSLDKSISGEQSQGISYFISDASAVDPQNILIGISLKKLINDNIQELTEKEAKVIRMRFGFDGEESMKLREIAKKLKMSPEGVRRIEMKALMKLKKIFLNQGIYGVLN